MIPVPPVPPVCPCVRQFPEENGLVRAKLLTSGYYGRVRKEDPKTTRVYYMVQVGSPTLENCDSDPTVYSSPPHRPSPPPTQLLPACLSAVRPPLLPHTTGGPRGHPAQVAREPLCRETGGERREACRRLPDGKARPER